MAAGQEAQGASRTLRADARRNRARIIEAARTLFAERGVEVPLDDVSDRADVGVATLYRHFPTREALVSAVFEAKLLAYVDVIEAALEQADPWTGFCTYIEHICAMQAADRGFTDVITMALSESEEARQLRDRARRKTVEVIRRAQEAGALREDFVPEDVLLVQMANAGVVHATREAAPHAWRRMVAFLLESFRAGHTGPLPAAPTPLQARRAMVDIASAKGICLGRRDPADAETPSP
jgi:AcrR family transcriptional regulator